MRVRGYGKAGGARSAERSAKGECSLVYFLGRRVSVFAPHSAFRIPSSTMPLLGAHMSIAGGYYHAVLAARAHQCGTVQLFTKNNNQWNAKPLTDDDVHRFKQTLRGSGIRFPLAHDSYLINLASPDETLYRRSVEAFVIELERAERLGLAYLVAHPGAHVGTGEEAGLAKIAVALDEVHRRCPDFKVKVLLETTAGQGSCLGHRFEHLAAILEQVAEPQRLGVCLDTCHVFAAGYHLAPAPEYQATMAAFDKIVGLKRLKAFHLNDSLKPFGSRVIGTPVSARAAWASSPFVCC